ncbi:MAG: hypothetical protein ACI4TZ_00370 [Christensenellales bacterium]
MNEFELLEYFKNELNNMIKEKHQLSSHYYKYVDGLEKCNFEKLQKLCNENGFYIYKMNNCPIDTEFFQKIWKKQRGVVIFSDYTLTLVAHYNR